MYTPEPRNPSSFSGYTRRSSAPRRPQVWGGCISVCSSAPSSFCRRQLYIPSPWAMGLSQAWGRLFYGPCSFVYGYSCRVKPCLRLEWGEFWIYYLGGRSSYKIWNTRSVTNVPWLQFFLVIQRLKWYGHMEDEPCIFDLKLGTNRPKEKPRIKYKDIWPRKTKKKRNHGKT